MTHDSVTGPPLSALYPQKENEAVAGYKKQEEDGGTLMATTTCFSSQTLMAPDAITS